ncbi:hypothetical protein BC938DRAFT_479878 [Jimgerdemannia flammicorona]|uniref:SGTA homodimerisation domain-containing protein n=1 Tax=Jimgerdemannia flammicorona TaxID=994334 RepID=A0A433QJX0_9FUNG|nr:hypothetical protein BC938DRAFT_479878 [Jimgerdemannia flammicorona]
MADNKKHLVFSILEFLNKSVTDGTIKPDDVEGIEVAVQCIGEAFGVDPEDPEQQAAYTTKPATLLNIFDVFLKTQKKVSGQVSCHCPSVASTSAAAPTPVVSEADIEKAEGLKAAGNRKVTDRNYPEAIKLYSEAIKLNPSNAVYYANRAAAYSQQGDHDSAIVDSLKAAEVDPNRMHAVSKRKYPQPMPSHAYFSLGKYQEAVDAYEKGLTLDPQNPTMKKSLETAKAKLHEQAMDGPRSADDGADALPGLPGGLGGMDFASLLNNPAIMTMAQQMMQSGALDQLMSNPNLASMAQNMMGRGGGGAPDVSELLRNPEMAEMARQMMSNMPPPGSNPPSAEHEDA